MWKKSQKEDILGEVVDKERKRLNSTVGTPV